MKAMLKVFRYELIRNVQRRGYLFTTFGIPLIGFVILFGYQFITNLNESQSPTEQLQQLQFDFRGIQTAGYFDQSNLFSGIELNDVRAYASEAAARTALANGEIDALYVIQPDYAETGDVRLVLPEFSLTRLTEQPVKKLIFEQMGQSLDRAKLLRLQTPVILNQVDLQRSEDTGDAVRNADSNMVLVYFFSIAFLMTVFGTSGYLMQSVIEEKETRVVEILITSVRPTQLLTGKVLSLGLLGLFQVLVWIVAALFVVNLQGASLTAISALTGLRIPLDTLPLLLVYFTLGYLLFAAIFGGIGAISGSLQEGPQIAIIFTLPAVIPFYVFPIFTATPNDTLPVILSIIPITAPLAMVMRSVVTVVPAWQIALSIGLLALSVIAAFWMAGRLFRVNTLLSGKVPKLREIPRLIFGRG